MIANGGPAFPRDGVTIEGFPQFGMSLRDYLAAKAMQAFISVSDKMQGSTGPDDARERLVRMSYLVADAMIKERNKE